LKEAEAPATAKNEGAPAESNEAEAPAPAGSNEAEAPVQAKSNQAEATAPAKSNQADLEVIFGDESVGGMKKMLVAPWIQQRRTRM
jgi:hypothetical protein